jgi:hypothetical protein
VQEASPEQVLAEEQPNKVRVTLTDESQVEVFQPVVSGDTLMGLGKGGDEVSVPLSDVEHVAVRKTDAVATVVLIGVGIPTLIAAGFLIFAIGYGSSVS